MLADRTCRFDLAQLLLMPLLVLLLLRRPNIIVGLAQLLFDFESTLFLYPLLLLVLILKRRLALYLILEGLVNCLSLLDAKLSRLSLALRCRLLLEVCPRFLCLRCAMKLLIARVPTFEGINWLSHNDPFRAA